MFFSMEHDKFLNVIKILLLKILTHNGCFSDKIVVILQLLKYSPDIMAGEVEDG